MPASSHLQKCPPTFPCKCVLMYHACAHTHHPAHTRVFKPTSHVPDWLSRRLSSSAFCNSESSPWRQRCSCRGGIVTSSALPSRHWIWTRAQTNTQPLVKHFSLAWPSEMNEQQGLLFFCCRNIQFEKSSCCFRAKQKLSKVIWKTLLVWETLILMLKEEEQNLQNREPEKEKDG